MSTSTKAPVSSSSLDFSRSRQRTILYSFLVAFALGLPRWWYLTTVPRASLPTAAIHSLEHATMVPVSLTIAWDPTCSWRAKSENQQQPLLPIASVGELHRATRRAYARVLGDGDHNGGHGSSPSLALAGHAPWRVHFDVAVSSALLAPNPIATACAVQGGARKEIAVDADGRLVVAAESMDDAALQLAKFLARVSHTVATPLETLPYSPQYELLVSLIVQDPSTTPVRSWPIARVERSILRPLLTQLLGPNRVDIVSQVQYGGDPGVGAGTEAADSTNGRPIVVVPADQLPHFVNPDWKLATVSPNHTGVHLITYLPDPWRPITLMRDDGPTQWNDFRVPRWGAVVVRNRTELGDRDLDELAGVWVHHLRELVGVRSMLGPTIENIHFAAGPLGVNAVEVAAFHLGQAAVHLVETTASLAALVRLTDQLDALPIAPEIADRVASAVAIVTRATTTSDNAVGAAEQQFAAAWAARQAAHEAFFHSDMVGLSYFPSEHTYAVYMPLFVPILVTVAVVVVKDTRMRRAGK
ncbi:phosphatidylinositol-glycan biosynthesis class S protein-domain-containing protein [Blastocladiella britannica]|nr:phosphatidylinositol-glycan biosynthesis class S protein-domain-containing protein [Blastocladiella britannica]